MKSIGALAFCLGLAAAGLGAANKAGDAAKGKGLFEQCAMCHNIENDEKKTGPSLRGLFKKPKLTNGKKPTEQAVRAQIDAGGNGMPSYKDMLSDEDKANLIAYLKTL